MSAGISAEKVVEENINEISTENQENDDRHRQTKAELDRISQLQQSITVCLIQNDGCQLIPPVPKNLNFEKESK